MFQGENKKVIIKAIATLIGLILVIALLAIFHRHNSMTLTEYEELSRSQTTEQAEPSQGTK